MLILKDILQFLRTAPKHPIIATKKLFERQWVRFTFMGALATLAYYLLGLFFVPLLHLPLLIGNTLAYLLAFAVSYFGHSRWTFQSDTPVIKTLPRFGLAQIFGLLFNSFIIDVLCHKFSIPYPLAMLAAIMIVPVVTYLICKFWVFAKKREDK